MTTVRHDSEITPQDPTNPFTCEGCGKALEARQHTGGRRQRYCGNSCRMRAQRRSEKANTPPVQPVTDRGHPGRSLEGGDGRFLAVGPVGVPAKSQPHTALLGTSQSLEANTHTNGGGAPGQSDLPKPDVPHGETASGWDSLAFLPPGHAEIGRPRRLERHRLRTLLNEISTVRRTMRCGRFTIGDEAATIRIKDGVAHWDGVETCAKVWGCPVCATKILARRADDATLAVVRHFGGGGGHGYFLTLTIQHNRHDSLEATIDVLLAAVRSLWRDKIVRGQRKIIGVIGQIRSIEVTHGENSWHPHAHFILFTDHELDVQELMALWITLDAGWARALIALGWPEGLPGRRMDLAPVTVEGVGAYIAKTGVPTSVGNELGRGDLKSGRGGSRTFFQIVADFGTNGRVVDLDLIHEHEAATARKSRIRWSKGLRGLLIPETAELTNEEIVNERIGGDAMARVLPATYRRLAKIPGASAMVLDVAEDHGFEGVVQFLLAHQLSPRGVVTPAEYVSGQRTDDPIEIDH